MNWDQMSGRWKQIKGKVREKWGKLTDDDLDTINGKREQLVGTIQRRYGNAKDEVERQVSEWENQFDENTSNEGSRVGSTSYQGKSAEASQATRGGQDFGNRKGGSQDQGGTRESGTGEGMHSGPSRNRPGDSGDRDVSTGGGSTRDKPSSIPFPKPGTGNTGTSGGKKNPPGR